MWRNLIFVLTTVVGVLGDVITVEQTQADTYQYAHHVTLDNNGKFVLSWSYYEDKIFIEMKAETTGWVGIGVSPNGGMNGADMAIGWVTSNGEAKLLDTHGEGNHPVPDKISDVHLQGGLEEDGWTSIKFWRKLRTCDLEQDRAITDDTLRMIWAFGERDISSSGIKHGDYHSRNRGVKSLVLLSNGALVARTPHNETDYKTHEFLNHNFERTHAPTYYNCKMFEMPKLDSKHHVVKVEAVIEPGNEQHVHHILLFSCTQKLVSKQLEEDHHCFSYSHFHDYLACIKVLTAWAIGGSDLILPEHVGIPIGDVDSPQFILMETHYDNPNGDTYTDSSGFRITYTDKLRQHDADFLMVGHFVSEFQIIPPHQELFPTYADCPSDCFDWGMKNKSIEEINIFGAILHSHTIGKSLELKHLRDGVELPPITKDNHYDFNYQELRQKNPEVKFKLGDSFKTVCKYDSRNREKITQGGLATNQEMCLAFLLYYPKLQVSTCQSRPERPYILEHFGLELSTGDGYLDLEKHNVTKDGQTLNMAAYLNQVEWTPTDAAEISEKDGDTDLTIWCYGKNAFKEINNARSQKITVPYKEETVCPGGGAPSQLLGRSVLTYISSLLFPLLITLL